MTTLRCMGRVCMAALLTITSLTAAAQDDVPQRARFDQGWMFHLGDKLLVDGKVDNRQGWEQVSLPHDWSIALPLDRDAVSAGDGGYRQNGSAWYVKQFELEDAYLHKRVQLYFEGVYMNATVYVNGQLAGGHPYGYSSFFVDITRFLVKGKNTVGVHVDNSHQRNSRWYSGAGIYRHVWLLAQEEVHFQNHGVWVETPDTSTVVVKTVIENTAAQPAEFEWVVDINGAGEVRKTVQLDAGAEQQVEQSFRLSNIKLWTPDSPQLYWANARLVAGGEAFEQQSVRFGVRTLDWNAEHGLLLNGKPVKLFGACVHHDNGLLGAAAYDDAELRKVRLLKEAGFNAVRTSHNPPSPAFLDACDELGLLVIDEAFDGWREKKTDHDYSELFDQWRFYDLDMMVRRDRNHPSIFCWSIGNEIIERKSEDAVQWAREMRDYIRTIDRTRPVTQALAAWDNDWEIYDPLASQHDIIGYNYLIHKAEGDHQRVPWRVIMQTESYPRDVWQSCRAVQDHPYVVGDFVWTGIDYLGESGIGRSYYEGEVAGEHWERPMWPWNAAYCGDIDLTGERKPVSYYREIVWQRPGNVYIGVREPDGYKGKIKETLWGTWPTEHSWDWPGWEGKPITVEVYTGHPIVRLYLNDELVGEARTSEHKATFTVNYQPGTLRAVPYREGGVPTMAEDHITTAGEPATIRLEHSTLHPSPSTLIYVSVDMTDPYGQRCTKSDAEFSFSVKGPADVLAVGNADPRNTSGHSTTQCRAYHGHALCILKLTGKKGKVRLTVESPGLEEQTLTLDVE
ncbi:MAG: DUF4982 domain-containing protein [Prevotella sp.]|nr:DUF4982 domain-containing protein [Prevotella sp.]